MLGQSNDRVASVGPLQERAVQYSQLQAQAKYLRNVLSVNVATDFRHRLAGCRTPQIRGRYSLAVDLFAVDAASRIGASTAAGQLLFTPPREDQKILDGIESHGR